MEIPIYELRKGSLISFEDYSMEAFEVADITGSDGVIHANGGKNGAWMNDISLVTGIPITPETLEAIGIKDGKIFTKDKGLIDIIFKRGSHRVWYEELPHSHILFIHQLQNFYLGVTGQELPLAEGAREKLCEILSRQ